ncbi:ATP-binding cassette domain-containing protein [Maricaulis sp.]|uniref:type I secretion system permease/ATPase n=1 Tax=Maricaulis sp. TaxID=1486257 RepID=UPI002615CBFA|nr:ATP-binding cassette domain-containing protein [Maricaulis sp.]MDF1768139.1 ATP-binding cassette domain-containing protein [Maricaulis sp.]
MQEPLALQVRQRLRPYIAGLAGFSLASNILLLVSPLYMLQVYDRVLSSGSIDTLIWLSVLAVFLLGVYGAAEAGRRRVSALAGKELDTLLMPLAFSRFETDSGQPHLARDLGAVQRIQTALQSGSLMPFADLPFAPLFLVVLFLIHPVLGAIGLVGAIVVFAVAVTAELTTRQAGQFSQGALRSAGEFATGLERQRSAMAAMGLVPAAYRRWRANQEAGQGFSLDAAKQDGKFSAISRSTRQVLQICVLGGGAALALSQEISPGAIVASSIILARTLGPIDQIVGSWRNTIQTWTAWKDLMERLDGTEAEPQYTPLPRPAADLKLDRLSVVVPGAEGPQIRPFSWSANGGQLIAVTGGNGAGKTTLLQTLAGAWQPGSGTISLGGRNLHDWPGPDRGRHVGYVPQDVELLPATVGENIARLGEADSDAIIAAARAAEAHETILALPDSYDTRVGPGGTHLSAGQRQMIGLARALYGDPVLLLLDEPTANLDAAAAPGLVNALRQAAERGAIILAATHDRRVIERATTVLLVRNGDVMAAPAEQFLKLATGPGAGGQAVGRGGAA